MRLRLDVINFCVAAMQTGFGPFIAVLLTQHGWSQVDVGAALSIGTVAAMVSQLPAGYLVDRFHDKRRPTIMATITIAACAVILAVWPARAPVWASQVAHGFASCMLGPAIAALTLAVFGPRRLAENLGHNARFASIGSAVAALALGLLGVYARQKGVFLLTAAFAIPVVWAVWGIRPSSQDPSHAAQLSPEERRARCGPARQTFRDKRLLIFAACAALFFLGDAGILPVAADELTRRLRDPVRFHNGVILHNVVDLWVSAAIIVPQIVTAVISPAFGRAADRLGRHRILLAGFVVLPIRCLLFAFVANPYVLVLAQALDGISAAVFGVMVGLVAADLTAEHGNFNLAMATINLAITLGSAASTAMAGAIAGAYGVTPAFLVLAGAGTGALLLLVIAKPETHPEQSSEDRPAAQPT